MAVACQRPDGRIGAPNRTRPKMRVARRQRSRGASAMDAAFSGTCGEFATRDGRMAWTGSAAARTGWRLASGKRPFPVLVRVHEFLQTIGVLGPKPRAAL